MKFRYLILLIAGLALLAACTGQPQVVEVTRLVTREMPVTVEVTQIVELPATVEVPVEVTRMVEVVVTATPEPMDTAVPTPTPPAATETPTPLPEGSTYTVLAGDTLSSIADKTGTAVTDIMAANNLASGDFIAAGQELFIPGWDGVIQTTASGDNTTPPTESETPPEAVVQGPNLLPNPSFEGDWHFYLYNELQVPDGWQLATDEGPNNLEPGSGGLFYRPEVRVVPAPDLPKAEQSLFIFEGFKTVKAFKGGAPTSFSLFTDVALQPGSYRLQVRFFPDTITAYDGNQKVFSPDPLAAEVRIIHDGGGTGWQGTQSGQRNTLTYDFTLGEAATVRLGTSFRNRFIMVNNGWFIDDWSLYALTP